jgi:NADH dehydrogenase [ubiquinone] 1 alpha subcomplex assembly factor 3
MYSDIIVLGSTGRLSIANWFSLTDMLILGLGGSMFPLSPETKRHINSLGIRVDILDTRNAAAQFNLLATERGVTEIAAAMIPIGWKARPL